VNNPVPAPRRTYGELVIQAIQAGVPRSSVSPTTRSAPHPARGKEDRALTTRRALGAALRLGGMALLRRFRQRFGVALQAACQSAVAPSTGSRTIMFRLRP
jgi:hypothetical protein